MGQKKKKTPNIKGRLISVTTAFFIILLLYMGRLYQLQIVSGAEYLKLSQNRVGKESSIKARRGEIADRLGRPLVVNHGATLLIIEKTALKEKDLNQMLLRLTSAFNNVPDDYIDLLPLSHTPPFAFSESPDSSRDLDYQVQQAAGILGVSEDSSPKELFTAALNKYKITGYTQNEARLIAGVRYSMSLNGFSNSSPFVFAHDVDTKTVTVVSEGGEAFPGVLFDSEPVREYVTPGLASHILGHIGPLTNTEYKQKKDDGYAFNDVIGKEGIEYTMEAFLRGTDGRRLVERNIAGSITEVSVIKDPVPGSNVYLTIDRNLQAVSEEAIARGVDDLVRLAPSRKDRGKDAKAAAVVTVEVETGEILSLASFPTFDLTTLKKNYSALISDPLKPTRNRAAAERYAPGSTFKLVTALACLQEGVLTTSSTFRCTGRYTYFSGYQPYCYGKTAHGTVNVLSAITKSCNSFFFDAGRRLGIDKMAKYAVDFGLEGKTGIQLTDEVASRVASPERREKNGGKWNPGDTIQAAIGQSDHEFTVVAMAKYAATLASSGKRMQLSLVKSVKNAYTQETLYEFSPKVEQVLNIDKKHFDTVFSGMRKTNTVAAFYQGKTNYQIEIVFKTGTAQTGTGKADNALLIGYAPADNPQIAFAIVVEGGGLGEYLTPVARDIINAYFTSKESHDKLINDGEFIY